MRVAGEEISHGGEIIWRKKNSGFRNKDGVIFPGKISVENEHGVMDIQFSKYTINSGLADNDLLIMIPHSA